jgi:anti-anti-sigma factor
MPDYEQFSVDEDRGVTVLTLQEPRIHDQASIRMLSAELTKITDDGAHQLLFDMHVVDFISSAVLNRLIVLDKQVKRSGGQIAFCNLRRPVVEVFSITKLDQLFPIYATRREAIEQMTSADA